MSFWASIFGQFGLQIRVTLLPQSYTCQQSKSQSDKTSVSANPIFRRLRTSPLSFEFLLFLRQEVHLNRHHGKLNYVKSYQEWLHDNFLWFSLLLRRNFLCVETRKYKFLTFT